MSTPPPLGTVYLVGAGPGAADLITVRGQKLLQRADVVFHDALVDPQMLVWCPQAVRFAVGKRCGRHACAQTFINKRLIDAAHRYRIVVRLKGGDPMLFGRADEEIQALEGAGVPVKVVPGVTAALAASASLAQSLTLRGVSRSVAFCTLSHESGSPTEPQLPQADTLAVYMGRRQAQSVARGLLAQGRPGNWPVCVVEAVTTAQERRLHMDLQGLAGGQANDWWSGDAPALLLFGAVFGHRSEHLEVFTDRRFRA